MNFLILDGSPVERITGLTASVVQEIALGVKDAGANMRYTKLNKIERCHQCGQGWGSCRTARECSLDPAFTEVQKLVDWSNVVCFVSPVYIAELSNDMKVFLDKLARCEINKNDYSERFAKRDGFLKDKECLFVGVPGGTSGEGFTFSAFQFENTIQTLRGHLFDLICVNKWNCDYKKEAVYAAAKALASNRHRGSNEFYESRAYSMNFEMTPSASQRMREYLAEGGPPLLT